MTDEAPQQARETTGRRFEFAGDPASELADLRRRLERLDATETPGQSAPAAATARPRRLSLFRKLKRLLRGLRRIHRTNSRLDALADEVGELRRAAAATAAEQAAAAGRALGAAEAAHDQLCGRLEHLEGAAAAATGRRLDVLDHELRRERRIRQAAFTEFDRQLRWARRRGELPAEQADVGPGGPPAGLQSVLESFYSVLETRYRGARAEIRRRLLVYQNDLRAARDRTGAAGPVIDLGCGRGEMLEMLREDGFAAVGVDTNATQLEEARQHGCAVVHQDALSFLRSAEAGSVLAVTGIHVIEHIPFPELAALMQEVARVLRPGGVAIFETPNPRNLIVGATTFHLDPTHVRPLPAEVTRILLEVVGFAEVETRPLHPSDTLAYAVSERHVDADLAALLYGPQDYAVIGVIGAA